MQKEIRVGLIGYKFMGKAHSHAYKDVSMFFQTPVRPVMQVICGRDEVGVQAAQKQYGWQSYETDWRRVVERPDVDLIDICTPNNSHAEIALAAVRAGKHVLCEKPLALTSAQAKEMWKAAEEAGVVHMICHNYRFAPAVLLAKRLIEEGRLGQIYHFRATFLQDWIMDPDFPLVWRLRKDISGSGAHGDIAAHIIDLARFLVGEIVEVVGVLETFVRQRPVGGEMDISLQAVARSDEKAEVTVDDASIFLARFESGIIGTFEATRFARGNRAGNRFEINGSLGSVRWDMENLNHLQVYLHSDPPELQGWRTISVTEAVHPYGGIWWPPGHIIGYEHTFIHLIHELLQGISEGRSPAPNFHDGVRNQLVLEAVERSHAEHRWVMVEE